MLLQIALCVWITTVQSRRRHYSKFHLTQLQVDKVRKSYIIIVLIQLHERKVKVRNRVKMWEKKRRKRNVKTEEKDWRINGQRKKGSGGRKKTRGRKKEKGGKRRRDKNRNLKREKARIKHRSSTKTVWAWSDFVVLSNKTCVGSNRGSSALIILVLPDSSWLIESNKYFQWRDGIR